MPDWRSWVVALDLPLRLQAPPCVSVCRRYALPAPEVLALRKLAVTAAQRLSELPKVSSGRARVRLSGERQRASGPTW